MLFLVSILYDRYNYNLIVIVAMTENFVFCKNSSIVRNLTSLKKQRILLIIGRISENIFEENGFRILKVDTWRFKMRTQVRLFIVFFRKIEKWEIITMSIFLKTILKRSIFVHRYRNEIKTIK